MNKIMTSLCLNVLYTRDSIKQQLAPFSVDLTFWWEAIIKSTYQIHTSKKYTMEQGEKKDCLIIPGTRESLDQCDRSIREPAEQLVKKWCCYAMGVIWSSGKT